MLRTARPESSGKFELNHLVCTTLPEGRVFPHDSTRLHHRRIHPRHQRKPRLKVAAFGTAFGHHASGMVRGDTGCLSSGSTRPTFVKRRVRCSRGCLSAKGGVPRRYGNSFRPAPPLTTPRFPWSLPARRSLNGAAFPAEPLRIIRAVSGAIGPHPRSRCCHRSARSISRLLPSFLPLSPTPNLLLRPHNPPLHLGPLRQWKPAGCGWPP